MIQYTIASRVTVLPGAETFISAESDVGAVFRPVWLVINDEAAKHLVITDLKVGKNSQLVSVGCLPGALFAESRLDCVLGSKMRLALDAVHPGWFVHLSVQSIWDCPVEVSAELCGYADGSPELDGLVRHYALGLGRTKVTAKQIMRVSAPSQVCFRPCRIVLDGETADDFQVTKVEKGVEGQPGHASYFGGSLSESKDEVELEPDSPVCEVGQFLTISAKNQKERDAWFCAAVLGKMV